MKLTICSETVFADRPLVERFAPIRELGVRSIELWGLSEDNVAAVEQGLRSAGCRLELFCEVLYDVYHMQIMEGDLISTLEANLNDVGHIHVADVPGRHEPGTGEINYINIARMLKTKGYEGFIGLECFPRDRSDAAIEAFRTVFQ